MNKRVSKYKLAQQLGQKLRDLRQSYRVTQEELAEKLDIHPSYVGQLERGEREASLHTLEKLASYFSLPPSNLLAEEEANKEETAKGEEALERCVSLLNKCSTRQLLAITELIVSFIQGQRS